MDFLDRTPAPRLHTYPDVGDDPTLRRWRATWYFYDYFERSEDRASADIQLQGYMVKRLTPTGAWIAADNWSHPKGWRWVSDEGRSAWAKPTKAQALDSLAVRYDRWTRYIARDIARAELAARAIHALLPQHSDLANSCLFGLDR